jgi:hypothetical protein
VAATEIGDGVTLFAHRLSTCLDTRSRYCRALTAQAIPSSEVINAAVAWTTISIFIRLLSGIVSVGLNALELVVDTYR